jgi:hypothetical protein
VLDYPSDKICVQLLSIWDIISIFAKPNIYICERPEFHTSEIEILWLEVIINNLKAMVGVI